MAIASKIRILLIERNMKIKDLAEMPGYHVFIIKKGVPLKIYFRRG